MKKYKVRRKVNAWIVCKVDAEDKDGAIDSDFPDCVPVKFNGLNGFENDPNRRLEFGEVNFDEEPYVEELCE